MGLKKPIIIWGESTMSHTKLINDLMVTKELFFLLEPDYLKLTE